MKIALVHDYLNQYGGGERVLEAFTKIWPQAPIFTLLYDEQGTGRAFAGKKIYTSFLQKIPGVKKHHRLFSFLMPLAVEQFDLSKYDLILSDSASYAKGVITRPQTLHICYCHTPIRYAWDDSHKYIEEFGYGGLVKFFIPFFINYVRLWDEAASARPDYYLTNSSFVAGRIKKYYHRESLVVHPPIKTNLFYIAEKPQDYFLAVGRFLPYKRFDLIIKAFNKLGLPLKIVGGGPQEKYLKSIAKPNIKFVGLVSDGELKDYYACCRAFIFPQEEDFGMVAAEAMASGRPVIAYAGGGALEMVEEGKSGIFFRRQKVNDLVAAVQKFQKLAFDSRYIREKALRWDEERFKEKVKKIVEERYLEFKNSGF